MLSSEAKQKLLQQYLLEQVIRSSLQGLRIRRIFNLVRVYQQNAEKTESAASVIEELQKCSSPPNPAMFQKLRVILSSRPQSMRLSHPLISS